MTETENLILDNQIEKTVGGASEIVGSVLAPIAKKIAKTKIGKAIGKDTARAVKSFDLRESKAVRVMSQLLGAPWKEQKGYMKALILFVLVCIFPAIPLFYIMGIMMKTLNYLFFYTRRL